MRPSQLLASIVALSFVAACETQAPPEDQAASREGLAAQIKAQTSAGVDGGAAVRAAPAVVAPLTEQPPTITYTVTATQTATGTGTVTGTGTKVVTNTTTVTGTKTTTGTVTQTNTQSATATKTFSATGVITGTFTGTKTGTSTATSTSSGTKTGTQTATGSATWTATYRGTGTATGTKTLTGTLTGTTTLTGTLTITATGTQTKTATKTISGTAAGTGTKTVTQTYTAIPTTTTSTTATSTGTGTTTLTRTGTVVTTATGTSTATMPNPCYGTWAFCDNFETGNGSGWNVRQGPVQNFSVVPDGSKVYRQNDASASQLYISQAQAGMAWMDSTVQANLKPLSFSSSSATVSLWGRYDATWNADCGYYVSLRGDGKVALGKRVAGVNTALGSPVVVPGGISTGTWYDVKLDMQGVSLRAYVNGTQLLTLTDSSCTSGLVGVGSVGASFESDNVRVTAPTTNTCVQGWVGTQCGAFCTYEATVQGDRVGCGAYLDCYSANGCSPETCGGQDDVCGVNVLNPWGTASKEIADQVYKCLGCAGSINCANPKYYNGTVCADGSGCTFGDTCQNKVCVPDPNRNTKCSASDQCHDVGVCDTANGKCTDPPKSNTTSCDDGNACTSSDMCTNGVCGGTAYACSDGLDCTTDACNGDGTCTFNLDPGYCAIDGSCYAAGTANPVNQCQACDSEMPSSWSNKTDGTICSDGNACTTADACQIGTCTGGGSGYFGPGEQCAPTTPTTPGPFGNFHCLLEEVPGTGKNILALGSGTAAKAWILRGTMDFSFTSDGAKLTKLSATGQQSRLIQQNGIVLAIDNGSTSSGTVDMTSGNLQVTLPVTIVRSNGDKTTLSLSLVGQVADHVLQGQLMASGNTPAQAQIFCREQFKETVASVTFKLNNTGGFFGQGPIEIFGGTPTMPGARSLPGSSDLVAELLSVTGEILDQYNIGRPWIWKGQPPNPSEITDATIRAPLSNRLGGVILRTGTGDALALADLTQPMADFCAGTGSQYCDYRAGTPVRKIFYTPGKPSPPVNQDFASSALPSSPRLSGSEVVLTTDYKARQPDVALDADGNAIVVWRQEYSKIMAKGIAKDGSTLFGPTQVNDVRCTTGWIPGGYPPPDSTEETGDLDSQKPVVALSNTSDRTFAVAWGAFLWLYYDNVPLPPHVPIICTRLMKGDGTPISNPALVAPSLGADGSVLDEETYVDIAMADSHEFFVAWSELPPGNNQYFKIAARRFGSDGLPKTGNAIVVSNDSSRHAVYPSVAMDKAGKAAITWMSTTDPFPSDGKIVGQEKVQRFNSDSSKRGDNILVQTTQLVGIPDVVLAPSGNSFIVTARSTDGDIYSGSFKFDDGTTISAWSRVNARTSGTQSRPVVVRTGEGAYMLTWMDEVGPGSSPVHPISGQVFDSSGVPIDIDFTISTQTPINTDPTPENPDFYWIYDAFAFRAAASQKDYALVWQRPTVNHGTPDNPDYEGGIVLQRLEGGAPDCPSVSGCGTAVPLRITGDTVDKIDVVLTPGRVIREDTGQVDTSYTQPYYSAAEFARTATDLIVSGYLSDNKVFPNYIDQFNFYYDMTQGDRTMHMIAGECQYLKGNYAGSPGELNKYIGYNGNTSFANVGAVVFRDYSRCGISTEPQGISTGRSLSSGSDDVRTGGVRKFWIQKASDYSLLLHESGHTFFELKGEYCGDDSSQDTYLHSNTYEGQAQCVDHSVDPNRATECHHFSSCAADYWTADSDACPMGFGDGMQFGLDCQRRAECVMKGLNSVTGCP